MRRALLIVVAACGSDDTMTPDAAVMPTANPAREIVATDLRLDMTAMSGTAKITLAAGELGATLEVGDLMIDSVTRDGATVLFAIANQRLDLGVPAGEQVSVDVAYHFKTHDMFDGASAAGFSFLWPYFCGNVFPCHSQPSDGTTFTLDITGVPAGKMAVYPPSIPTEAPSYQIAWAIAAYIETPLGTTTAGTQLSVWHLESERSAAMTGTANLVAAFDWLEKTIGPYRFGDKAGTISVQWPRGAFGGMEHHPRWHVGSGALDDQVTNVHEAAHGWYGDGIRISCWEDFVLSEGTVSYLAARALDVVAPTAGAAAWQQYANELAQIAGTSPVWPQSCGVVDVLADDLFTNAPYMRGAFFYKALADKVGAALVDQTLATFYRAHAGGSATMAEMLTTIQAETGYDATACAQTWLRSTTLPVPGPCP